MTDEIRCKVEIRQDADRQGPGRLFGTLIEYQKVASDRREMFLSNSLEWPDNGVVVNLQHDRAQIITRVIPELRGSEVIIDSPLPDTQRARDVSALIRDGTLTGMSLEFVSRKEQRNAGVREIRQAKLTGAAIVDSASYPGTLEMREKNIEKKPRRLLCL